MAPTLTKLVIVESPTKARTIEKVLGPGYRVQASMGHVRDLPASAEEIPEEIRKASWARLGVNVDDAFEPVYVIPPEKKKVVAELKRALKDASEVYLATDEDREGESIGWHLREVLRPKVPVRRMVFHEITPAAIRRAIEHPRELDEQLVYAQETRRILDRLVGYVVSPVLWKKVKPRLSAGRVQSVAVRLLVMRERERMAFVSGAWWDITATLEAKGDRFDAGMISLDGRRLASGGDFDERTGRLKEGSDVLLLGEAQATELAASFADRTFRVDRVERKESVRRPYPPFTTSTLQQEANRKLGFGAQRTMQVAQRLYESGLITYMRTDSVHLSEEAISAARNLVEARYGKPYLSPQVRQFKTTSAGAQEAHEAIRPAGTEMRSVEELGLRGEEAALYELIWKRTVATQMADAKIASTTVWLQCENKEGRTGAFRASGREVLFPGFFRAYVEGSDDPEGALEDRNQTLPSMAQGQAWRGEDVTPKGHETRPPARYTEASLVKTLESEAIGRPSTYATIIDTIQRRGYVFERSKQLVPTWTAIAVTQLLEAVMEPIVDPEFTKHMEAELDAIATVSDSRAYLERFYKRALLSGVDRSSEVEPKTICSVASNKLEPRLVRVGRYGPYVELTNAEGGQLFVNLREDVPPADVTAELLETWIREAEAGDVPLGVDPETREPIYVLTGRFGPYVQRGKGDEGEKPKRVSLAKGMSAADLTLDQALSLLSLPRTLGTHPETGKAVQAGIGQYGPYVVHERVYASLGKTDDVLRVNLDRALDLLAAKAARGRGASTTPPLRELGVHPQDDAPVVILDGRYGPYIKHGKTNVTLPEGVTPEGITLEAALALIDAKAGRKGKATSSRTAKAAKTTAAKSSASAKTKATKTTAAKTKSSKATAAKGQRTTATKTTKSAAAPRTTAAKSKATKASTTKG